MGGYPKFGENEYPNDAGFFPSLFDKNGEPVDVTDIGGLDMYEIRRDFGEDALRLVEEEFAGYEDIDDEGPIHDSYA